MWWKEGIVYQIYPRSFNDSNGDGVGDIRGIIEKLDYIKSLGVDMIWLCPVYSSPNDDNGYDISDYYNIMEEFGTMEDFDEMLAGMHKRGLKLIMDLVVNHSSDEHAWFKESRKSKDNPYRDWYYWRKGENDHPPNNWMSFFSGSTWEYDETTDEYYLHLFTKKQPDLNWENPKVRQACYDAMKFWFDKGIDGFRMDVISLISKDLSFPDANIDDFQEMIGSYSNGPRVHEFLQEMNREVLSKYDIMTVGEGPGITQKEALDYVGASRKELNMVFSLEHMFLNDGPDGKYDYRPMDFLRFKALFDEWNTALGEEGWGSIFLSNHDFPRVVSRYGNDNEQFRKISAKMLAMLLLTHRGTVYIYQGCEIGMTNVAFQSMDDYRDVEVLNAWKDWQAKGMTEAEFLPRVHTQGRDNVRTPIHWNDSPNAGFTTGKPWIRVNPNYPKINVEEAEADQNSVLHFYRKAIQYRKASKLWTYGTYVQYLKEDQNIFAYQRVYEGQTFLVVLNHSDNTQVVQVSDIARSDQSLTFSFGNYDEAAKFDAETIQLRGWEGAIFEIK